jgi:hypothetical protein
MAQTAQLVAQLEVVVDLAVLDQRQATVVAAHGHVPERTQVEDAQPLAGEGARAKSSLAAVVWSAMALGGRHRAEGSQIRRRDRPTIEEVDARDATHGSVALDQTTSRAGRRAMRHWHEVGAQDEWHTSAHSVHEDLGGLA